MNKKERVQAAIKFKNVDRIPIMYRGLPFISKSLMDYFNIGDKNDPHILVRNHDVLLEKLGADFWSFGCNIEYFATFVPRYIGPEPVYMDRNCYSIMGIPTKEKIIEKYKWHFTEIIENPLAGCESPHEVEGFLTKKLNLFDYNNLINFTLFNANSQKTYDSTIAFQYLNYEKIKDKKENFVCKGNIINNPFMWCSYLRGMDNFLFDLIGNTKMAEAIVNEVGEFIIEFNRRYVEESRIKAEYYGSWDDVCMQNGLMFSPATFKKYFLPIWKELISMVKSQGMIFHWHCCGNVNEVLPIMIDAGIDVFDVVQTSAKDMGIEYFYKNFEKEICIHGGIDVQKLLINGNPGDIEKEVEKIKNLWGKHGGIIIGPSHEILPETKIENIIALYNALNRG